MLLSTQDGPPHRMTWLEVRMQHRQSQCSGLVSRRCALTVTTQAPTTHGEMVKMRARPQGTEMWTLETA